MGTKRKRTKNTNTLWGLQPASVTAQGSLQVEGTRASRSVLSPAAARLKGSKFRWLNERLYTMTSQEAVSVFTASPELFAAYHEGAREQYKSWSINPLDTVVQKLINLQKKRKRKLLIADMGCGEAKMAELLSHLPFDVRSFDLVAVSDRVTACDIACVPLEDGIVDVVVFCLSLMGTNYRDFIEEGRRVLKADGIAIIVEVESRLKSIDEFVDEVEGIGFKILGEETLSKVFVSFEFCRSHGPQNPRKRRKGAPITGPALRAVAYKKR